MDAVCMLQPWVLHATHLYPAGIHQHLLPTTKFNVPLQTRTARIASTWLLKSWSDATWVASSGSTCNGQVVADCSVVCGLLHPLVSLVQVTLGLASALGRAPRTSRTKQEIGLVQVPWKGSRRSK